MSQSHGAFGDWILTALRCMRWRVSVTLHEPEASLKSIGWKLLLLPASDLVRLVKLTMLGVPVGETTMFSNRYALLEEAIRRATVRGLWLEFGVASGDSLRFIADRTAGEVFGFDSFEGLPTAWQPHVRAGAFSRGGQPPPVPGNVRLVKGLFEATLPGFFDGRPSAPVSLAHVDCDLYASARLVLAAVAPRLSEGSVVIFDEFCGLLPDDECRAWRELQRSTGVDFRWIGASPGGSVALQITGVRRDTRGRIGPVDQDDRQRRV